MNRLSSLFFALLFAILLLAGCNESTTTQPIDNGNELITEIFSIEDSMDIQIDGFFGFFDYPMDAITQDVLDNGAVMVYWGNTDRTLWSALPYDFDFDLNNDDIIEYSMSLSYDYSYTPNQGFVSITFEASNDTLYREALPLGPYKVVVIPAN